ncbi:MAG: hypothetical protein Q4C87_04795 [Actinomycetaceae bacterium]|nr:hypothetical protein [Actinomycetaceae bacterium]
MDATIGISDSFLRENLGIGVHRSITINAFRQEYKDLIADKSGYMEITTLLNPSVYICTAFADGNCAMAFTLNSEASGFVLSGNKNPPNEDLLLPFIEGDFLFYAKYIHSSMEAWDKLHSFLATGNLDALGELDFLI